MSNRRTDPDSAGFGARFAGRMAWSSAIRRGVPSGRVGCPPAGRRAGRTPRCRSRPAEGTMGRGSCTGQRSDPPHWSETPPDERHLRGRGPRRPPHRPGARARRRPGRPQHDPGPRHRRRRRGVHHRADHARVPPQGPDRVRGPPGPRSDRRAGALDRVGRDRPPGHAAGAGAAPARREERDRGRLRQGRRGQEHGQRQPRRGPRARRRGRGPAGCRHHRPQHPDDARRRGPAHLERQQQDRPARAPRREGDLDPVLRPRGPADRVARPADRRRDLAVPARRRVGRPRLPRRRPAARDVGRAADPGPGRADQRHRAGDDAAGRRAVGRHARRWRCSSG